MQRLTRMDGLRGVLAIYVMLGHALPFTSLPGWLTLPFSHGEAAVDLFFCLSGLVVMNSLERLGGRFLPFMVARGRRLLPVYFVSLAGTMLLLSANPVASMPWLGPAGAGFWATGLPRPFAAHLLAHLLLLHGIIPAGILPYAHITLLAPAWSLSTEWQFYILLGLFYPRRIWPMALVLLAAGAAYHSHTLPPWWQFSRAFLPDPAAYFALGLVSILLIRDGRTGLFLLCLAAACGIGLESGIGKALVPLAWGAAMLAQRQDWGRVLDSRPAQFLGAISYPLYLMNEPVQRGVAIFIAPMAHGSAGLFTALWLPLALTLPVVAATLLHFGVELPAMSFRRGGAKPAAPGPKTERPVLP